MKIFKTCIFLLFLCFCSQATAQVLFWQEEQSRDFIRLDFAKNEVYRKNDLSSWVLDGHFTEEGVNRSDIFSHLFGATEVSSTKPGISYLMTNCTGQVYEWNRKKFHFKRIDKTFFRGANCLAFQFHRKGVLYSFGGYGFWRSSNILTEYDFQNGEWRSISATGNIPKSINMSPSAYFPKKDRFVTMANLELNDTENKADRQPDWNIYEFNFEKRQFTIAGEIKLEVLKNYLIQDLSKHFINDGRYLFLVDRTYKSFNFDAMYIIDVLDGYKVYQWKNPHRLFINDLSINSGIENALHVRADSLHWTHISSPNPNLNGIKQGVRIKDLLAESTYLGSAFDLPWYIRLLDLLLAGFGILVVGLTYYFWNYLRRRKLKKQLDYLLGENERQLLDFLMLNYKQGFVNGHQIISFFGKHKSSPESQRQFRSKLIENFSKALGLLFQEKKILDVQTDEKDQRMYMYRLNAKIYKKVSQL
jgi:hypothetical protein